MFNKVQKVNSCSVANREKPAQRLKNGDRFRVINKILCLNSSTMTNDHYFDEMMSTFPSLKPEILEWDAEMVHFRMETFAVYTIEQIKKEDKTELIKCFDFQESKIDLMSSDLVNALTVSYCEALLLGESSNRMKDFIYLMPPKLKAIYIDYEIRYNELTGKALNRNQPL